jgi:hypothetical protein
MRPAWLFALFGPLLIACGCGRHSETSDVSIHDERSETPDPATFESNHETADNNSGVRVWRFPFVQIAIDPHDPKGVSVRVADDEEGHEYVDLGVSWDDD